MIDVLIHALQNLFTLTNLGFMLVGVGVGLVVGILPALGGIAGMSLLLPFVYGMEPTSAVAMMVGLLAVIPTSDTFYSILMGIPGSAASQAAGSIQITAFSYLLQEVRRHLYSPRPASFLKAPPSSAHRPANAWSSHMRLSPMSFGRSGRSPSNSIFSVERSRRLWSSCATASPPLAMSTAQAVPSIAGAFPRTVVVSMMGLRLWPRYCGYGSALKPIRAPGERAERGDIPSIGTGDCDGKGNGRRHDISAYPYARCPTAIGTSGSL